MFLEPTLLDIEKQWETDRSNFHVSEWKDSGLTSAEWAWLKYPSFWELGRKAVPTRLDGKSWWDWSAEHLTGQNLHANVKTLLSLQVPSTPSSLTAILTNASKVKLGLSKSEVSSTINYLVTPESLTWSGEHGENPWDAALATRDSNLFETLLVKSAAHGLLPDTIVYPKTGNSLLHQAVMHDWENGVRLLIEHGVNPDLSNKNHQTPKELAKELNVKGALRGFNVKKEVKPTSEVSKRAPVQSSQMDLF